MRIDRALWHLRLARTRTLAQALVATGHLRRNGERVLRASLELRAGDVLTLPGRGGARVIEVLSLPSRRGPPVEARACYRELDGALDAGDESAIAAPDTQMPERGTDP